MDWLRDAACLTPLGFFDVCDESTLAQARDNVRESAAESAGEVVEAVEERSGVRDVIQAGGDAIQRAERTTMWITIAVYGVVAIVLLFVIWWFFGKFGGPV